MNQKKGSKKITVFLAFILLIFILDRFFGWSKFLSDTDNLLFLKQTVNDNLIQAILIYVLLTIVGCVVLAVPGIVFAVLAGMLFGPVWGIIACLAATTLGAMMAFVVGRFFLKDTIKPMLEKNRTLKNLLFQGDGKKDIIILMITRMIPIFPYNLQNFAYGITDIRFSTYSICTFIFMLPGVAFFTIGAAGLTAGEDKWKYFLVAGILAVLVTGAGLIIQRKYLGNDKDRALILFTRVPIPGQTKTRLMPQYSAEECARIHGTFIKKSMEEVKKTNCRRFIFCTPIEEAEQLRALTGAGEEILGQEGDGIGERMQHAFRSVFEKGYRRVVLIGTDVPEITADILDAAFMGLIKNDIVINPTEDGGYYLIGMKKEHPEIWDIGGYGTDSAYRQTMEQARKTGLSVQSGAELCDIDTPEDLEKMNKKTRLSAECIHCNLCRKNCLFLDKYEIDLSGLEDHPELAYSCFLCGRCKQVCPKDIDGARIALNAREQAVSEGKGAAQDSDYKGVLWEKNPYRFANYRKGKKKSVLFPGCSFPSFFPETTRYLEKTLAGYGIGVVYDCCRKPVYELGLKEDASTALKKIEEKMIAGKVEEIITVCPNCYHFMKDKIEIPVITIYEKIKELEIQVQPMPEDVAVYFPCPDRETKEIFEMIQPFLSGKPRFPYQKVQCCGLGGCAAAKEGAIAGQMSEPIREQEGGLYTYCASCVGNFKRKGCHEVHHFLPELLGIQEELPKGIKPFLNRAKKKL